MPFFNQWNPVQVMPFTGLASAWHLLAFALLELRSHVQRNPGLTDANTRVILRQDPEEPPSCSTTEVLQIIHYLYLCNGLLHSNRKLVTLLVGNIVHHPHKILLKVVLAHKKKALHTISAQFDSPDRSKTQVI